MTTVDMIALVLASGILTFLLILLKIVIIFSINDIPPKDANMRGAIIFSAMIGVIVMCSVTISVII